jgi:hypothetical protein
MKEGYIERERERKRKKERKKRENLPVERDAEQQLQ